MVRAMVSRNLTDRGWAQSRIANKLGISQAMVSKYLMKPFPMDPFEEADHLASELTSLLIQNGEEAAITGLICQWCFTFKEKGNLCTHHPIEHCSICMTLRSREAVGERFTVLSDIENALGLLHGNDLSAISPQVRMNIAMSLTTAKNTQDVASIPGRIIPVVNGIRTMGPPEFGVSQHLAGILLLAKKTLPGLRAVMNIRYDEEIKRAMAGSTLKIQVLDRINFQDAEEMVNSGSIGNFDILIDPGDFGIEPCTYVFGTSASRVVGHALNILLSLTEGN